jgi:isoleucyl-tRNA synthetase
VHLAPFVRPAAARWRPEAELGAHMRAVRELVTLGRAAREEAGIKVRQPLSRMVCVVPDAEPTRLAPLLGLLEGELNVKRVELATSADALVRLEAKPNFRALGRKFGKSTPLAAQAVAVLDGEALRNFERGEPLAISVGNESRLLDAEDLTIVRRAAGELVVAEGNGFFAAIDPTVTPALRQEGLARELISRVQQLRKRARFAVSDRIVLHVAGNEEAAAAVGAYRDRIAAEVLAREIVVADELPGSHEAMETEELDGAPVRIAITRIA